MDSGDRPLSLPWLAPDMAAASVACIAAVCACLSLTAAGSIFLPGGLGLLTAPWVRPSCGLTTAAELGLNADPDLSARAVPGAELFLAARLLPSDGGLPVSLQSYDCAVSTAEVRAKTLCAETCRCQAYTLYIWHILRCTASS